MKTSYTNKIIPKDSKEAKKYSSSYETMFACDVEIRSVLFWRLKCNCTYPIDEIKRYEKRNLHKRKF
ncbi:MAG: hypothetical protein RR483_01660 [Clostridia bacterium]